MIKPKTYSLSVGSLFVSNYDTNKLKAGETYVIKGWGKGKLDDSGRREFWVIENFYNAGDSFSMWKDQIEKFHEEKVITDKGILK